MTYCLVVDDSSVIRKVARRILEGLSFEVSEAEDGQQALDSCLMRMPDAILLDWSMPEMDGYQVLQRLREFDAGKRPKVVFCTTENDVAQIAKAIHMGADDYVLKPFDRHILTEKFGQVGLV
jgi:two-component system chemotaxis response regulator CheY